MRVVVPCLGLSHAGRRDTFHGHFVSANSHAFGGFSEALGALIEVVGDVAALLATAA